jgi:hypothetical protein
MKDVSFRLAIAATVLSLACSDQSPTSPTVSPAGASLPENARTTARLSRPSPRVLAPRKSNGDASRPLENGSWGSAQSSSLDNRLLTVTLTGATFRSECSDGVIDQRIQLDASGRFDVGGTYQIQAGPVGLPLAARFVGSVIGETMTITVFVREGTQVFGPFTLRFGQEPRIGYCPIV